MKRNLISIITAVAGGETPADLSVPESAAFGHYSTNVAMRLAKVRGKAPLELAGELASAIAAAAPAGFFEKVEAVAPGFINFWLSAQTIQKELADVAGQAAYGRSAPAAAGQKTAIVEYSSVNIAKAMNLGHFRTTIIGDALANLLEWSGWNVVRWNYLGDWGTQFGKLIAAYKLWGDRAAIEAGGRPVEELQKLYVRFHDEAKADPAIEARGQEEFKKLESGDAENRALWEWFKKESLAEFEKMYKTLGVTFDVWIGESFFEPELGPLAEELASRGIAERSEGALVIKLDAPGLPPGLIQKSDGASLYLTRDIANLRYRLKEYVPAKILYVVANEQALHFEQLFAVAKLLGLDSAELTHVKYGLVLGEAGKKLSTRGGNAISLADAVQKSVALARGIVEKKNGDLSAAEKDAIAEAVGLGALKYNDLKENRMTDIVFDWEKMLDFTGDSGPYLQYTYARLMNIVRKAEEGDPQIVKAVAGADASYIKEEAELALARKIFEFPDVLGRAAEQYSTSVLATYLYKLAVTANKFYETTPILKDDASENAAPRRTARLMLVQTAARTLSSGLGLLGISTPEKI